MLQQQYTMLLPDQTGTLSRWVFKQHTRRASWIANSVTVYRVFGETADVLSPPPPDYQFPSLQLGSTNHNMICAQQMLCLLHMRVWLAWQTMPLMISYYEGCGMACWCQFVGPNLLHTLIETLVNLRMYLQSTSTWWYRQNLSLFSLWGGESSVFSVLSVQEVPMAPHKSVGDHKFHYA